MVDEIAKRRSLPASVTRAVEVREAIEESVHQHNLGLPDAPGNPERQSP